MLKKLLLVAMLLGVTPAMAAEYLIDVRTAEEYNTGHVASALNIVHTDIVNGVKAKNITPEDTIKVYCRSGKRASLAKEALEAAGYTKVENLGGYEDIKDQYK